MKEKEGRARSACFFSLKGNARFSHMRYDCVSHRHIVRTYESQYRAAARGAGMPTAMIFDAVK